MLHLRAESPADTASIAAAIATLARVGDLIVLAGEMGAGKTAFAKGFGASLGVSEPITSPTFTLVHSYQSGRVPMHHADIYRLSTHSQVADLAFDELLDSGIVLVEWGDVVADDFGDHVLVRLEHVPDDDTDDLCLRDITIESVGRAWTARWERLESALEEFTC